MKEGISKAVEDYLKVIYDLTISRERASTNQIAQALTVKPASVSGMIKKLSTSEPPLVDYQKHHGVALTEAGEKVALETIRHHRLLETFLHETLGFDWESLHEEADRLEHVISEEFEERIAEVLGNPTHDPHGDPIPSRELEMPVEECRRLNDLRSGEQAVILRVPDHDPELLRYLGKQGIIPGAGIEALAYTPFDQTLKLRVEGHSGDVVLGFRITRQVYINDQHE